MAIEEVTVHVDNSAACVKRLQAAIELARQHNAHLMGLYVLPMYRIPTYAEVQIGSEVIEQGVRAMREKAETARVQSKTAADNAGVAMEWRSVEGELVTTLTEHARYTDVMVLGQGDPSDTADVSTGVADRVVLESGAPIVVIPYIGPQASFGDRILIAWNASRESSRAVRDALPFLQRADAVEVLSINPERGLVDEGDIPSADISRHLARHGVKVNANSTVAKDIDAGDVLLSRAADMSADLIVMGGYGHSRFRETVLGGVTRHLLSHMTVPVLLSH